MDISVLILFFNRPEKLAALFAEVRKAQPARLFLYQDGARGEQDYAGVEACRKVVAHIDWPCEVHRLYQEQNYGCDPSNFMAQRWAFSLTDKCIVFEDDDIPTLSFFRFCHDMLERYANDERVGMIQGFNLEEHTVDAGSADYFFSTNFSIWGWASWSRVVNNWDEHYAWLDDAEALQRIQALTHERKLRKDFLPMARAHKQSGKAYYETIFHAYLLLHSQLAIVPRVNMISNRGVTNDSVHFAGSVQTLPSGYRRIFTMGRHELQWPLKHPRYIVDHVLYRQRVYRIMAWRHPWVKAWRSVEELYINIRHGQWQRITSALVNRLRITLFGQHFH
ncbi:MAG: hemolysin activation protein [Prevotella sp.]|nr:hemolysin activation protein [Prevotella sp.]MDY5666580.1 hemolysin activation protein [Alloprevotella sp.]